MGRAPNCAWTKWGKNHEKNLLCVALCLVLLSAGLWADNFFTQLARRYFIGAPALVWSWLCAGGLVLYLERERAARLFGRGRLKPNPWFLAAACVVALAGLLFPAVFQLSAPLLRHLFFWDFLLRGFEREPPGGA